MKNKHLHLKRALCSILFFLLLSMAGITKLQAQNITFADANVKAICVANWDTDGDGELNQAEAAAVTSLDGVFMFDDEITSFDELSFFTGVASIGEDEFNSCTSLTAISIPNTVTSIGNYAFSDCIGLTSITSYAFTPPVLGSNVFDNVPSDMVMNVPCGTSELYQAANGWSGLSNYEEFVFDLCPITFADDNVKAICVAQWDTNNDGELSYAEAASVTNLATHFKSTNIISFDELEYFTGLTSLPNTAFYGCTSLASITLPSSVSALGNGSFYNCTSLAMMTVYAETPPTVGTNAFKNVPTSMVVHVSCGAYEAYHNADDWNVFSLFNPCPIIFADANVKDLCVANWDTNGDGELSYAEAAAVTSLGYVFRYKTSISSFDELQYFTELTSIGTYAFYGCSSLASIEIPNSVTYIGYFSFYNCNSLASIEIPSSVTSINSNAFSYCSGLEQMIVDSGNTVYDSRENCNAIIKTSTNVLAVGCKNTIIPNTVTSIGENAFYECKNLLSIEISNSVTSIGSSAFSGSGLVSVEIPNSVTSIGSSAFSSCISLISIKIPNSITSIGSNAFYGCSNMSSVTVLADIPPTVDNNTFYMVNKEIPVYVPCGSVETYTTTNWGGFNNFVGICGGTVSVAANPEEGGMVTGNGVFEAGESCTVTATENEGYIFALWTRNGTRASINPEYTFYVSGDMNLVAHFVPNTNIVFADANVKSVCVNHWDYNGDGELSYAEASLVISLGEVFKNNVNITSFDELQYFIGLTSIGSYAFNGCRNLTSIEIPNSVTSIGYYAFYNCTDLTSITLWADNPPTLGYNIGVGKFTHIYVPCNAAEVYQNAENWSEFKNILGMCSGEVAVMVNPSEGGTVTGTGYYDGGELCVLTATPNPGYGFVNWIEKGVVSTDSVYSFRAHATTITANFCSYNPIVFADDTVKALCVANWDTNGDGELSYIEAAAVTSLDEVFRENTDIVSFDELQYFIGLTSIGNYAFYHCTGLTSVEIPNSVSDIGTSAFGGCYSLTSITVWADNPPFLADGLEAEEGDLKEGIIGDTGMAFGGVDISIPIYVPCNAVEAYQDTEGWNEFSNLLGMCSGEVAVTVNPSEGGTVTGAGYYNGGDFCVLTATSNPGFSFAYWTENGVLISWDSVYSFHAHPTTIIANFCSHSPIVFADDNVKALCVANWDTNGDGELSYNEAAVVASLENVFRDNSLISSFDELQYFVGLTSIGSNAFYNCSGLTSIQIPNFVTSIGSSAFYNCAGLISIEIPNFVTSIGYQSFYNCSGLRTITVLADNPPFFGSSAFYGVDKYIPVYVQCNAVEVYQNYYWNEFTNIKGMCSGEVIVMVNPSEGGTVAGAGYYDGGDLCILTATPNLGFSLGNWTENGRVVSTDTIYSFPAHPTTIVANFCSNSPIVFADANVKALCVANWDTNGDGELSYTEAANVMSLGEVFRNNSLISSFDELQYFIGLTSISNYAFYYCTSLTSIEIPNSVNSIGNHAFMYCNELSSIEIPNSVVSIDSYAFYHCTSLTSIEIPNSVISISNYVFKYCTSLTSVEIPNTITYFGYELFGYCTSLTSIEIPNSVITITDYAFRSCTSLTSIEIPNSVTSMGANPFTSCSSLEQIIVEAGNTVFDSRGNCNAVIKSSTNMLTIGCKNTVIPNFVTSIAYAAFYGCTGLSSIEIPNTVTSINKYAFYGCSGLTFITVHAATPPTIYSSTFENCPKTIPVYVPCGRATAYQAAAYWNEFTNFIEMCEVTQTCNLSQGWNWFSTNVEITLDDLKVALVEALPGTNITIKSKDNGNTTYNGTTWRGQLTTLDVAQMYRISVSADCEITLEGTPINPAEHPVTISNGANWIAFPFGESMTVNDAFAGFAVSGDVVKSKENGIATYNGTQWRGTLNTLVPGQGYIYKSNSNEVRTFIFPSNRQK